jgi:hypothetical protein
MANVTHEARKVTRAKVHSLCPVKFEAQQMFGAFGPPNGTKFKDEISTRQLESKWPQPDLPMKA